MSRASVLGPFREMGERPLLPFKLVLAAIWLARPVALLPIAGGAGTSVAAPSSRLKVKGGKFQTSNVGPIRF